MNTRITLEITTPDLLKVFPEEGQKDKDFVGKEKELEDFRKEFANDLHKAMIQSLRHVFKKGIDDIFFGSPYLEEFQVEGWDEAKDYGVKIKLLN